MTSPKVDGRNKINEMLMAGGVREGKRKKDQINFNWMDWKFIFKHCRPTTGTHGKRDPMTGNHIQILICYSLFIIIINNMQISLCPSVVHSAYYLHHVQSMSSTCLIGAAFDLVVFVFVWTKSEADTIQQLLLIRLPRWRTEGTASPWTNLSNKIK